MSLSDVSPSTSATASHSCYTQAPPAYSTSNSYYNSSSHNSETTNVLENTSSPTTTSYERSTSQTNNNNKTSPSKRSTAAILNLEKRQAIIQSLPTSVASLIRSLDAAKVSTKKANQRSHHRQTYIPRLSLKMSPEESKSKNLARSNTSYQKQKTDIIATSAARLIDPTLPLSRAELSKLKNTARSTIRGKQLKYDKASAKISALQPGQTHY